MPSAEARHSVSPSRGDDWIFAHAISRENMERFHVAIGSAWDPAIYEHSWPTTENYTVFERGRRVGVLRLRREPDAIYVGDLQVLAGCQGRGAGTFALQFVERLVAERGLPCIRLRAFADSRAVSFYRRAGFETVANEGAKLLLEKSVTGAL